MVDRQRRAATVYAVVVPAAKVVTTKQPLAPESEMKHSFLAVPGWHGTTGGFLRLAFRTASATHGIPRIPQRFEGVAILPGACSRLPRRADPRRVQRNTRAVTEDGARSRCSDFPAFYGGARLFLDDPKRYLRGPAPDARYLRREGPR
jgi:hypothetical protein